MAGQVLSLDPTRVSVALAQCVAARRAGSIGADAAGTATGRKGSMWAAVPAACEALGAGEDAVPLGPGQLPPRNAALPPLHAEINISMIMIKGQLELEVTLHLRTSFTFIIL